MSAYYAQGKAELLQKVVVNATYTVDEGYDYDNWNGGEWGHLVRLSIPAELFLEALNNLEEVQTKIAADLNRIAMCAHERVSAVTVEQTAAADIARWREKSGALITLQRSVKEMADAAERLWTKGYVRAFLSHKADDKKQAAELKSSLSNMGISAFVAHEDIEPTREWQDEIELALSTLDVCVALLTSQFHDSKWTDQEVGIAIGRGVPIVAVRLGQDPYGFIGKFQGVAGADKTSDDIAVELMSCFMANEHLRQRMAVALVCRFENAVGYVDANRLVKHIEALPSLSPDLIQRLENSPNQNRYIARAWAVQNRLPSLIGRLRGNEQGNP